MQYFQTPDMRDLGLPFSAAVRVGDMLYLSGALGNVPGTLRLAEGGLAGQARQAMENIGAVLRFCGLGFADVVKCTVMMADMSEWSEFNKVYATYFAPAMPSGALGVRLQRARSRGQARGRMSSPGTPEPGAAKRRETGRDPVGRAVSRRLRVSGAKSLPPLTASSPLSGLGWRGVKA